MGRDVARGRLVLPVDDDIVEMYRATRNQLASAGYAQYEISNWARPGQQSRHNLTYWRDEPWIGLGAGAASSYAGRRWKNSPVLERYIGSVEATHHAACVEDEQPDLATRMLDCLSLGLRLREGVSLATFRERFGQDALAVLGETGAWLLDTGLLRVQDDRLRLDAERQFVINEVLVRIDQAVRDTSSSHSATR
jgi:oxygen-independent coproporphyrinogen-3 oxidase